MSDDGKGDATDHNQMPFPTELLDDYSPILEGLYAYFSQHTFDDGDETAPPILEPSLDDLQPAINDSDDDSIESAEQHHHHQHEHQDESGTVFRNRFWHQRIPGIGYQDYLRRIGHSMPNLEPTILLALPIYAKRLAGGPLRASELGRPVQAFALSPRTLHRFTITAVCLAGKALGDRFYSNGFCAAVGGIGGRELGRLELELAARLGWRLQCSAAEYAWSLSVLSRASEGRL